eukprot:m.491655 g.491655  ORF g.491655 m.491655 type:complete len:344 (+) comp30457_c0_seq1:45-1076(+)
MAAGGIAAALRKHWFLVGIVLSISLARLYPALGIKGGPLVPEITIKYGAVGLIFFNSGLTLRSEELVTAFMNYRLHVAVQGFTLVFVPFFVSYIANLIQYSQPTFSEWLIKGLVVVGCMPPPVSSAVILTRAVGGNEAGAIFNSAFGSFLGIVVTPLLLLNFVGVTSPVPLQSIFLSLFMTVVAPLVAGQIVRYKAWSKIQPYNIPFGTIGSATLLLIIYATFCQTFFDGMDVDSGSLTQIAVVILLLQTAFMGGLFLAGRWLGFPPGDVIALVYCATHKSLTLGIPMVKIVFQGHKALSLISLPLLVYHPCQILYGSLLVPWLQSWLNKQQASLLPTSVVSA